MRVTGVRTLVVSALVAAVAVRVTATQPTTGAYARVSADPGRALREAADGWTVAGTLGDATAQGLRDIPLAAFSWLTDVLGLTPGVGRTAWCVAVLVLAVVGAVRLGRASGGASRARTSPHPDPELHPTWTPWVGAAIWACGPVLVATLVHAPGDGLAVAVVPWVLTPLLGTRVERRAAVRSAAWLGLAGAGSPHWALAALAAGLVAAAAGSRRPGGVRLLLTWSAAAAASSAWWIAAYVWEASYATDLGGLLTRDPDLGVVGAALGLPGATWVAAAILLAPLAVAVSALVLRVDGDRAVVAGLLALAVALAVTPGAWPSLLPVPASAATATDGVPAPWLVVVALVNLAALLAWTPAVDHVATRLPQWTRPGVRSAQTVAAVAALAAVAVASAAGPVLAARSQPSVTGPDQRTWAGVADWSASAPPGRVLVLPAVADGRLDDAVSAALRDRPWIARDTLPPSAPGATAALDGALGRLGRGHDGAGTAASLRHLGVSYVLLRNDVGAANDREQPVALARLALSRTGATRVAVLGPGTEAAAAAIEDLGVRDRQGTVEVWALDEAADGAVLDDPALTVAGNADVVGDLADAGLAARSALVLAGAEDGTTDVLSDSARRRDVDQRVAWDGQGPVLPRDATPTVVPPGAAPEPTSSSLLLGARSVRASSSRADLDGLQRRSGAVPTAAVDGNAYTAWQSRRGSLVGEWWEVTFDAPTDLSGATLQVVRSMFSTSQVTRVRLESDTGGSEVDVPADGAVSLAALDRTERLRVVATEASGAPDATRTFSISELTVPDLAVEEALAVDGDGSGTWVLASRPPSLATCAPSYPVGGADDPAASETVCNGGLTVDGPDVGPLARVIEVPSAVEVAGRVWARAADSESSTGLAAELARPSVVATGSSVASTDLVAGPQAAADADPGTAWRPAADDPAPTLELSWERPATVTGVRVVTAQRRLSSRPTHVVVEVGGRGTSFTGEIDQTGSVTFPPVRTRRLSVTFAEVEPQLSVDSATGGEVPVPLAVSEVEVVGGPPTTWDADRVVRLPCGSGPEVSVGERTYETAVEVSAREVVEASVVAATLCERPRLGAGEVRVGVEASFSWIPLGLVLSEPGGPLGTVDGSVQDDVAPGLPAGVIDPRPRTSTLATGTDGRATLVLSVPAGRGWTATAGGQRLEDLTVDGWAQAWEVPAGAGDVTVRYASGERLRWVSAVAALGWSAVLLLAAVGGSRTRRPRDGDVLG
ncbi:arabinofuranan 3-O-arabinosyltransferase [Nocardioides cavernae]|uniref:Arabinofuranan 3-O-arabinosyltransferase n=1 Tax=Nocardioides cavernae TaxID=1921566 RepID=A0A7Y9KTK2_9ACTN|nr:arabinofuranan 3-O-arabinosyltransferase [Nocardioides cavernae]